MPESSVPVPRPSEPLLPDIRSCPFCGNADFEEGFVNENEGIGNENGGEATPWYRIICRECGVFSAGAHDEREALAQWNQRYPVPPATALDDAIAVLRHVEYNWKGRGASSAEPAPPTTDARKLGLIEFALKAHRFIEAEDFDDRNAAGEIAAHCSCGFICSPEGNEWMTDHRIAWERHVAAATLAAKPSYSVVMDTENSPLSPVQEEATPTLDRERLNELLRYAAQQHEDAASDMRRQRAKGEDIPERHADEADDDAKQLRSLASTLPSLLELAGSVTAWLNNLRAAMPKASIVSPTGEAIVGAALGQLYQLAESQAAVARLTTELEKFRDWFQNAEQARAVAEAKLKDAEDCDTDYRASLQQAEAEVERLTREKAQLVEDLRREQDAHFHTGRERDRLASDVRAHKSWGKHL